MPELYMNSFYTQADTYARKPFKYSTTKPRYNNIPYTGNREFYPLNYTKSIEGFIFMEAGPQGKGYYRSKNYIPEYTKFIGEVKGFDFKKGNRFGYYPTIEHKKGDSNELAKKFKTYKENKMTKSKYKQTNNSIRKTIKKNNSIRKTIKKKIKKKPKKTMKKEIKKKQKKTMKNTIPSLTPMYQRLLKRDQERRRKVLENKAKNTTSTTILLDPKKFASKGISESVARDYFPKYKRFIGNVKGFVYMENGPNGSGYYPTINSTRADLRRLDVDYAES